MEEEEDETVIFQNSPLYNYLRNVVDSDKSLLNELLSSDTIVQPPKSETNVSQLHSKLCNDRSLRNSFKLFAENKQTKTFYINELFRILSSSELLEEEDAAILQAEANDENCEWKHNPSISLKLRKFGLLGVTILFMILWYFGRSAIGDLTTVGVPLQLAADGIAMLYLTIILTGYGSESFYAYRWSRFLKLTTKMVANCHQLDDIWRQTLRILREREILSRGCTVVTKYTVAGKSAFYPCAQRELNLRRVLFSGSKRLLLMFRELTLDLAVRVPPADKLRCGECFFADTNSNFLFGNAEQDEYGLSLSLLKACCYFLTLRRSEFLRHYWFCYEWGVSQPEIMQKLNSAMEEEFHNVSQFLSFYRVVGQSTNGRKSQQAGKTDSARRNLYDYSHSFGLHLQMAFEKNSEFENMLLGNNGGGAEQELNLEACEIYRSDLEASLRKCQSCLEEIATVITSMKVAKSDANNDDSLDYPNGFSSENESGSVCVLSDESPPEIVDQVFEGTAGDFLNSLDGDFLRNEFLLEKSPEFLSGRRNVLDELKQVLTIRSEVMKKRELTALAAKKGVSVEQLMAEETAQEMQAKASEVGNDSDLSDSFEQPTIHADNTMASEFAREIRSKFAAFRDLNMVKSETIFQDFEYSDEDE